MFNKIKLAICWVTSGFIKKKKNQVSRRCNKQQVDGVVSSGVCSLIRLDTACVCILQVKSAGN